jgi:NADPH:quinone reductase-like Zn-dependent oxidoreductase
VRYHVPTLVLCLLATVALLPMSAASAATTAASAGTMRAVVVVDGHVQIQLVPEPQPQPGEVRIKVRAVSVNPVDWKKIAGAAPGTRLIPGRDLAGVIDAVGDPAGPWKVGQAVIAVAPGGSYVEYAISPVTAVAAKPPQMSFEEAAGLPIVGETAWRAMVTVANVQAGQRVLVHGGAGGVGSAAVQIAKARGAYVIATASPSHNDLLHSLGADEVLDYNSVRFEDKVRNVDVVLNTVDADTTVRLIGVVKRGGILVSVVGPPPQEQCAAAGIRCAVTGSATGEMLEHVSALAAQGKLHMHIDRRWPLANAAQALELNRQGHTGGKIILEVGR